MSRQGVISRRQFLAGAAGGTALAASGLLRLPIGRAAAATSRAFTLRVREGTLRTVDGKILYARGFADGAGTFGVPGPVLWANEGDPVTVAVLNESPQSHSFAIDRVVTGAGIAPGGSAEYSFQAPHAGTYIYYDPTQAPVNRALGLYGALVVMSADGSTRMWTAGPAFDDQFLQVLSELDESWNTAVGRGDPIDPAVYRPNYFFINGRGKPDNEVDPNAYIRGTVGQTIAIRWANAGLVPHSMHTHGYHFKIVQQNGVPESAFREKDNVPVYARKTLDVTVLFDQPGRYPIHDHILMAATGNGVYPKGMVGMFDVA